MSIAELVGNHVLRIGNSGPAVEAFQIALRDLGYPLRGTGYFANATDVAVREFQKRAGLKPDGEVGQQTAKALDVAHLPGAGANVIPPPVLTEIQRPLWLQAEIALIGLHEGPGRADNPTIIEWAKDLGGDIGKEYTHDSIPWCALFQNHGLASASLPGTGTLWALDFAGHWPCVELSGPAVGAFAPMLRDGGGHVINIAGRARSGNLMGCGGNQNDAVSIEEFHPARLNKGYWWPKGVPLPAQIGFGLLPIISSSGRVSTNEA